MIRPLSLAQRSLLHLSNHLDAQAILQIKPGSALMLVLETHSLNRFGSMKPASRSKMESAIAL
jgi:hypothetical protein